MCAINDEKYLNHLHIKKHYTRSSTVCVLGEFGDELSTLKISPYALYFLHPTECMYILLDSLEWISIKLDCALLWKAFASVLLEEISSILSHVSFITFHAFHFADLIFLTLYDMNSRDI